LCAKRAVFHDSQPMKQLNEYTKGRSAMWLHLAGRFLCAYSSRCTAVLTELAPWPYIDIKRFKVYTKHVFNRYLKKLLGLKYHRRPTVCRNSVGCDLWGDLPLLRVWLQFACSFATVMARLYGIGLYYVWSRHIHGDDGLAYGEFSFFLLLG
jgi:hypothetical protein